MALTPADTLVCDTAQIAAWQRDEAYNYGRELLAPQDTLMEWLGMKFNELLFTIFGRSAWVVFNRPVLITLGVLLLVVIVWFLYKNRPELFSWKRKTVIDYELEEETIYGIDFDAEIQQALRQGNYWLAVRYTYLKVLRHLSDEGRIDWQPSKTPTQYVYEVKSPPFRELTSHFLRVRYGNFEATQAVYEGVQRLADDIIRKGGEK